MACRIYGRRRPRMDFAVRIPSTSPETSCNCGRGDASKPPKSPLPRQTMTSHSSFHPRRASMNLRAKNNFHFEKLVAYCVALANEGGGRILGVTDKPPRRVVGTLAFDVPEKTVAGIHKRHPDQSGVAESRSSRWVRAGVRDSGSADPVIRFITMVVTGCEPARNWCPCLLTA